MMMKRRFCFFAAILLFAAASVQAQKIDARLTELLPGNNKTLSADGSSQVEEIDTAAVNEEINVTFNSDGTVKSFSAFAMLKEGCDCPTAKLP